MGETMKRENIPLVNRNRFFAEIGGSPCTVRISDNRHFDYGVPTCSRCGHSVLTEFIAKPVPPERTCGINFYPEIVIDQKADSEMHFEICDRCGTWFNIDFVRIIGPLPKSYTVCQYKMAISRELAEAVELIFWERDENICEILYELKRGNEEYLDRISKGALTADEQTELFKIIDGSETK